MKTTRARNEYELTEYAIVANGLKLRLVTVNKETREATVIGPYADVLILRHVLPSYLAVSTTKLQPT
jgi:hypothetical protein